jgi:hypothetical protein
MNKNQVCYNTFLFTATNFCHQLTFLCTKKIDLRLREVRQSRENLDNQVSTSSRYGVLSNRCDGARLNFLLKQSY